MEKIIKNKVLLLLLMVVCGFNNRAVGQILQDSIVTKNGTIYNKPTVMPEFPGGMAAFYKFVAKNFRIPKDGLIDGKVIAEFVIDTDGTLTQIKVVRNLGHGTKEEAERVLALSPKWKPGEYNGKIVKTGYTLPIQVKN